MKEPDCFNSMATSSIAAAEQHSSRLLTEAEWAQTRHRMHCTLCSRCVNVHSRSGHSTADTPIGQMRQSIYRQYLISMNFSLGSASYVFLGVEDAATSMMAVRVLCIQSEAHPRPVAAAY